MSIRKTLAASCDRCGKLEEVASPYDHDEADLPSDWGTLKGDALETAICDTMIDLCSACLASFKEWYGKGAK